MEPHHERVVVEREELAEKLEKLQAFLKTQRPVRSIDFNEERWLIRQAMIMRLYIDVLDDRITAF